MSEKRKVLFESESEEEENASIKINKKFAKRFNASGEKKERSRLAAKYGDDSDTSGSSEDETGEKLPPTFDYGLLDVLASLKKKDPKIYDRNHKFFTPETSDFVTKPASNKKKNNEKKALYLPDHEINLMLKYKGQLPEEEDELELEQKHHQSMFQPTYVEEQELLKESLKAALNDGDDEDDGDLLTERKVSKKKELAKQEDVHTDKKKQKVDKKMKKHRKVLLEGRKSEEENFLFDYILNKKYAEPVDTDDDDDEINGSKHIPTYDEILADDDAHLGPLALVEKKDDESEDDREQFTKKMAEMDLPDTAQQLKSHPRKLKVSLRKKDDARRTKRLERKTKKKKEKTLRMEELKRLKVLKRKEIMDKLERVKKITGNARMGLDTLDIKGDFDPDQHDKQMQELFSQDYYGAEEADEEKPQFTDDDEDDAIENWDEWRGEEQQRDIEYHEPHCEDPDFNMDCDYDPRATVKAKVKDSMIKIGRKRKIKKSDFAKAVEKRKPQFDPSDKEFEEYFDEYYKLDYEDMVGDLPCRFKYRKVVPNDFGLSVEEILAADVMELNMWCPVSVMSQYRKEAEEKDDVYKYHQESGRLARKKKKIFTSLFGSEEVEDEQVSKSKKAKKAAAAAQGKADEPADDTTTIPTTDASSSEVLDNSNEISDAVAIKSPKKSKKKWRSKQDDFGYTDARLQAYGIKPKRFRNKIKYGHLTTSK